MKTNIEDYRKAIEAAVSDSRLKEAFRLLRTMVPGSVRELRAEINNAEVESWLSHSEVMVLINLNFYVFCRVCYAAVDS